MTPNEPEQWTEVVRYEVTRREEVWKTPEFDYWLMTTQLNTFWVWGPGFLGPHTWRTGWQRRSNKSNVFDGYWEANTLEEAVKDLPYRVATALMKQIRTDMPNPHGASRYDHQGCRCDVCKAAKAAKQKEARERKKVSA